MFLYSFVLPLLAIPPTFASNADHPITISRDIQNKGNGCPSPNSVAYTVGYSSVDLNTTTNVYTSTLFIESDIVPIYGAGTAPRDRSKTCEITIDMKVDPGYKVRSASFSSTSLSLSLPGHAQPHR